MKTILQTALLLAVVWVAGSARSEELGDAHNGAIIFEKCKSCHQIGEGAANGAGPQLNGIFGRKAGTISGFKYSKSLLRARHDGLIWTARTLDAYLENPKALVSQTRMSFPGLRDPQQRGDVLAYLRAFSDDPADIPEAEPTARASDHDLDPAILALTGDPEYGEYLASECTTCHRSDGENKGIPGIIGWPTKDFVVAMHAYKRKLRPHPVMQMMAGRLSDEEIASIAVYFKDLK